MSSFNKVEERKLVNFSKFFVEKFRKPYAQRLNEYILTIK
jgi:hypothetical protein